MLGLFSDVGLVQTAFKIFHISVKWKLGKLSKKWSLIALVSIKQYCQKKELLTGILFFIVKPALVEAGWN